MYSDPFSTTIPIGVGIENPYRVKWFLHRKNLQEKTSLWVNFLK